MSTQRLRLLALLVVTAVAFAIVVSWPLQFLDYDVFYHLAGGRYFFEHLRPPGDPYFSYLPVHGKWIDYYWGFQALVYSLYKSFGFSAFVVMRAVLFAGQAFLIFSFFSHKEQNQTNYATLIALLFTVFYLSGLFNRVFVVRPHTFSYIFMILFISICEYKERLAWFLPLIALLWSNMHGVEYPVLWLICGAYAAEACLLTARRRPVPAGLKRLVLPLAVSLFMPLANPGGIRLLLKPFQAPVLQDMIIRELKPLSFSSLWDWGFAPPARISLTLSQMLVLFLLFSPLFLFRKKTFRLSRLVLYLGGAYLLFQAQRFSVEFVILALPLAGDAFCAMTRSPRELSWKKTAAASAILVAACAYILVAHLGDRPHYPVSDGVVPVGAANFLEQKTAQGLIPATAQAPVRIAGDIESQGYLLWRLYPRFRVSMDLETMLFTPFDLWLSYNALYSKDLLGKFISRFSPGFLIAVPGRPEALPVIAAFPQYAPVFVDTGSVVFADSARYPELVRLYGIKYLPLDHPEGADFNAMSPDARAGAAQEISRMLAFTPDDLSLNLALARIYLTEQNAWTADYYASVGVRNFPENPKGYIVKGMADAMLGDFEQAAALYEKALQLTPPQKSKGIALLLSSVYTQLKQYKKAYAVLRDIINPMYWDTTPAELYEMGAAAQAADKPCEALVLLDAAAVKALLSDTALRDQIRAARANISQATHDSCKSTW